MVPRFIPVLLKRGFFEKKNYLKEFGKFGVFMNISGPGWVYTAATGSLGHGLPMADKCVLQW